MDLTGKWCGKCGTTLRGVPMPSGVIPVCPTHGAVDDEYVLTAPPETKP